jgi:hypothetical protein
MDCALETNKPSRVSDPRKLIIEECFRNVLRIQPRFSMITSLYLIGSKEPERVSHGQFCNCMTILFDQDDFKWRAFLTERS